MRCAVRFDDADISQVLRDQAHAVIELEPNKQAARAWPGRGPSRNKFARWVDDGGHRLTQRLLIATSALEAKIVQMCHERIFPTRS